MSYTPLEKLVLLGFKDYLMHHPDDMTAYGIEWAFTSEELRNRRSADILPEFTQFTANIRQHLNCTDAEIRGTIRMLEKERLLEKERATPGHFLTEDGLQACETFCDSPHCAASPSETCTCREAPTSVELEPQSVHYSAVEKMILKELKQRLADRLFPKLAGTTQKPTSTYSADEVTDWKEHNRIAQESHTAADIIDLFFLKEKIMAGTGCSEEELERTIELLETKRLVSYNPALGVFFVTYAGLRACRTYMDGS